MYKNNPEIKKIKKVAMCFEINKPPYSLIFKLLAITSENKNCIGLGKSLFKKKSLVMNVLFGSKSFKCRCKGYKISQ